MKIVSLGGGPAGLYFSLLMKKAFPASDITVYERNRPDDTFGWGVVFSRETLSHFESADPESYRRITGKFAYWDDIETWYRGARTVSTGHGFCGLARRELLLILQERCRELGVQLHFQHEVKSLSDLPPADLVLAADGVHSPTRAALSDVVKPSLDTRPNRFCWLGTTRPLRAFTFVFKETPHGLFRVHAYPFDDRTSTWIVECTEDTWRSAGLDRLDEAGTVAFCEALFAEELEGHPLLANRSTWRTFPTVRCAQWSSGNVVLMGDAVHTAHFSIGSGTKLAMEDAVALVEAFRAHGTSDVPAVLAAYQKARQLDVLKIQRAAQTSLEWFEHTERYAGQHPLQFTFNLMTRSKRITWENLRLRDAAFVDQVDRWFATQAGTKLNSDGSAPPPLFAPFTVRSVTLPNRVVVSPMCQYAAKDGVVGDWHLVHYGSRAVGGAGLVLTEMTDVSPEGRITPGCAGIWSDAQEAAWKRVVDFVHSQSDAKVGLQLAHAGRKGSCSPPSEGDKPLSEGGWECVGPSAIAYKPDWHVPKEMDEADMARVVEAFAAGARRADRAGFDVLELHAAHGYLLSSFLSPLSNRRADGYGGSLENRLRFPLRVLDAVRAAWPAHKPLFVRISASDWLGDEGLTTADAVAISRAMKAHGADVMDVSTGGNVPESRPETGRMYQVPFAEAVRYGAGMPVMAVGALQGADHANTVLAAGRADLCALARAFLSDPYLVHQHAQAHGVDSVPWPREYLAVKPRR
ncbi:MAG: bifunctional salicylyl-CoA 5-hydroxylase/oxidoreductase [Deltaproteobacteria bacterium]|nr:bifunctional salicylyl-CoA 5-hydroxylase/oxidoreductase [Deltaproteobacteria bacterium]